MKAPLYNELIAYSQSKHAFHMPGHKFGTVANISGLNLAQLDNTEALGLDNLYEAEGIIKEAMDLMAHFYSAKSTIFLTNGSTAGILASILAVCKEGDQLIVARNAHHSVWHGLILAGVQPIYVSPEYLEEEDLLGEMSASRIEQALKQYPEAKGVLIVSPTYEGIVSDIKAISEVVHRSHKVLIVDEAHGAHFVLGQPFPKGSIHLGADLVINSTHKTLPALTQSGLLHRGSERVSYERLISSLRMIQTSSPSYVMMGLMDYMRSYIEENQLLIKAEYTEPLIKMRQVLKSLKHLKLIEMPMESYDISKVIISTKHCNISGYQLADWLNEMYEITVEAALENYIILMTTMADSEETLTYLSTALMKLDEKLKAQAPKQSMNHFLNEKVSLGEVPRKIHFGEKSWQPIKECKDAICAQNIMLYPPGIPIICIGERIDELHRTLLERFKEYLQGIQIIEDEIYIKVVDEGL